MSLAANRPRPCEYITHVGIHYIHRKQNLRVSASLRKKSYNYVNTDLDAGAGQVDVGSPLTLHPAVLRGPGVHYWRLAMGSATFSLGHILVRPSTVANYSLWVWPLC